MNNVVTLKRHNVFSFILLAIAVLFVSFFSDTTSPFYDYCYTTDSSVYMMLGRAVVKGKLPYVDIWELKGPAIFYIEALGYWLTYSKLGIFAIQVICLYITYYYIYRTFRIEFSMGISILLVIFSCLSLGLNYQGGNLIEEYTLPLIASSIFILYKWSKCPLRNNVLWHCPYNAALYGVVLGFSLMTRLTDALGICAAVMVIAIYLLVKRQWKNLLHNVVAYILGFVTIVLPFCIYFYAKGVLYEMWYGTFIFNLSYTAESSTGGISDLSSFRGFLVAFLNSYTLFFIGFVVILFNKSRRLAGIMWMVMGAFLFTWFANSNGYGHYGMLAMPYLCLIINELYLLGVGSSWLKKLFAKTALTFYILIIVFFGTWICLAQYQKRNNPFKEYTLFVEILSKVPKQDQDKFVAYNVSPSIYEIGNLFPCYKCGASQDWLMGMSKEQYGIIYEDFATCRAKWILVADSNGKVHVNISSILSTYYKPAYRWDGYVLYNLNS